MNNLKLKQHISNAERCNLCDANIDESINLATGNMNIFFEDILINTVICNNCNYIFQKQVFSDELLNELYINDDSYYFDKKNKNNTLINLNLLKRQNVLSEIINKNFQNKKLEILDVGGGVGDVSAHLSAKHTVTIIDATNEPPLDSSIKKINGILSEGVGIEKYSVIILNHVLEHTFNPTHMLNISNKALVNNGILIVEVPFEIYTPYIFNRIGDWRHVSYFCRATLINFLNKTGFHVDEIQLVFGYYDVRKLPVIRAVARKVTASLNEEVIVQPQINKYQIYKDLFNIISIKYVFSKVLKKILNL